MMRIDSQCPVAATAKNLKAGGDDGIDSENRAGEAEGGSHGGAGPSAANSGPAGAGWSETAEQRQ